MAFFDNVNPEEFLLFIRNFQITLEVSGTLSAIANMHYLFMLICDELLFQINTLYVEVGSTTISHLNRIIGTYFFPVNALSK